MKLPSINLKTFLTTRRKIYELLVLLVLNIGLYFVWSGAGVLMLFNLGFIWNWAASQDLNYVMDNQRYRFSLMKMVYNLERIFLIPFRNLPPLLSIIPKILPAGLFWILIIHFASSDLPWWPTFIGSLIFELTQLDALFIRPAPSELPPEIPATPEPISEDKLP